MYYSSGRTAGDGLGIGSESPNAIELTPTITYPESERVPASSFSCENQQDDHRSDQPTAGRNRVRKWFTSAGNYLGDAAHEKLAPDHGHNDKNTKDFPEVPGEILRNARLVEISRTYSHLREERENSVYAASIRSTTGLEGSSSPPPIPGSSRPETSPSRPPKRRDTLEVPTEGHRGSESR